MQAMRKLLCLLFILLLMPVSAGTAAEQVPSVRVLLSRLALTDRADLTLEGTYAAHTAAGTEILFPEGSGITVQLRDGKLILFYAGMSLSAGKSLTLKRQGAEAVN